MGSWPEGVPHPPTPQKPEGITDQEWAWYQTSDPSRKPELRDKIEAALGWKQDDVDAAREIAEQVLGAVKIAEAGAGEKGHVPEENLARYRRLRELAHLISRMGNMVSNLGEHGDANTLWALGGKYKRMANELRVDISREEDNEHHD